MVKRKKTAEVPSGAAKGPSPPQLSGAPTALMWATFILTAVVPLLLFAAFDWLSASWFFKEFVPSLRYGQMVWYSGIFALSLFSWLLYSIRPVWGLERKGLEDIRKSREPWSISAIPALALSLALPYVLAKDGLGVVDAAMATTAFWLFGLAVIQAARYVDEFVLRNRPDCVVCHSPLEIVLFVFAAAPGSLLGVAGYILSILV